MSWFNTNSNRWWACTFHASVVPGCAGSVGSMLTPYLKSERHHILGSDIGVRPGVGGGKRMVPRVILWFFSLFVLLQDPRVNRLEDSILLWKGVTSNKLLANVNIVLFLNVSFLYSCCSTGWCDESLQKCDLLQACCSWSVLEASAYLTCLSTG